MLAETAVSTGFYHIWGLRSFRLRELSGLGNEAAAQRLGAQLHQKALMISVMTPLGVILKALALK